MARRAPRPRRRAAAVARAAVRHAGAGVPGDAGVDPQPLRRSDVRGRPVAEAVEAIGHRAGRGLVLLPEGDARWQARRITLEAAEPVPFWTAIDRLCRVAGLRLDGSPPMWNQPMRRPMMGPGRP